jgi:1-pyrroline-5-carboxylate dehydrogenase
MSTAQISTVIQPLAPQGLFRNEPFIDFSDRQNVHAMQDALARVGDLLGHEYQLVIGGERSRTAEKIQSLNPARPAQIVGIHQKAGQEHAEKAVKAALEAFATWQ